MGTLTSLRSGEILKIEISLTEHAHCSVTLENMTLQRASVGVHRAADDAWIEPRFKNDLTICKYANARDFYFIIMMSLPDFLV